MRTEVVDVQKTITVQETLFHLTDRERAFLGIILNESMDWSSLPAEIRDFLMEFTKELSQMPVHQNDFPTLKNKIRNAIAAKWTEDDDEDY